MYPLLPVRLAEYFVLGTLFCLKEIVGTAGQAPRGLLAEEIHPSAVPGVGTWELFSLPLTGERADGYFPPPSN